MIQVKIILEFDNVYMTSSNGECVLKECVYDYLKELMDDDSLHYSIKGLSND